MKSGLFKKLEDVCNVEYGTRVVQKRDGGKGYPVYGGGGATFEMKIFNRENRLVIARFGMSEKCTRIVPGKFFLNDSGLTVSSKNELMNQRFLDYHILSLNDDIFKLGKGTAQKNLDVAAFRTLPLFVPTAEEQKRIVAKLDEAFAGLAKAKENAEKNLQNARALFESHLEAVFTKRGPGWVEKRLEEVGKTQTGSTPKTSDKSNYGDHIPFIKPGDFNPDGTLQLTNDGLSKKGLSGARVVPTNSVLMVCIGATIGKCGYCDQEVTTNQQINSLTPNDGSSNRFLYYQMLTNKFQQSVIKRAGQATLPIINKSKWSALTVWLPPALLDQKRIATSLDAVSGEKQRLARIYEQKLEALESLKKSVLHEAFSGNL